MNRAHEMQTAPGAVWAEALAVRAEFVRKTYVTLFVAVLGFMFLEVAIFASGAAESVARTMFRLPGGWLVVLGGFILVSWMASRAAQTARTLAAQYAALAAFVAAEALIVVPLLYVADEQFPGVISSAAVVTLIGFSALTGIAMVTGKDFSFLRGVLAWGGVCALLAIVGGVIFGFTLGPLFSVAMIALAGASILYDTSEVLHRYPRDRHVSAALSLFASVALMFWYVLRLFMSSRD